MRRIYLIGATSGICKLLSPMFEAYFDEIVLISRRNIDYQMNWSKVTQRRLRSFSNERNLRALRRLILKDSKPIVAINFVGSLGELENLANLKMSSFRKVLSENLDIFILMNKIMNEAPAGSLLISFSGAGVGGPNLDSSSIGYLASKAAMAILIEAVDIELGEYGIHSCLIAPGAFPTGMQRKVAESLSPQISQSVKKAAQETLEGTPRTEDLFKLIQHLCEDPAGAGGRIWSARFDSDLIGVSSPEFGKLRRIM